MRTARRRLRVRGLVSLRERVRDQASRGLEPGALAALRAEVESKVAAFEELCRVSGVTPGTLPAPTRNAYRYLKTLDFARLPVGRERLERPARVRGVVASYHAVLDLLAREPPDYARARSLASRVTAELARATAERGLRADALPARSADAHQALVDLEVPGHAERIAGTTHELRSVLASLLVRIRPREVRPVALRLVRTSCLWRVRETTAALAVTVSDAFAGAPRETLELLARWAFGRDHGQGRAGIEAWLAAERPGGERHGARERDRARAQGLVYSLDELFLEVNREHFEGALARPGLAWTRAPTFHKFGHYTYTQDRVVLSASLDHERVPRFVVAYVLFHELLHKSLGMHGAGHRRRAHTAEFRARERRFPRYAEATGYLDRLARSWRRRS